MATVTLHTKWCTSRYDRHLCSCGGVEVEEPTSLLSPDPARRAAQIDALVAAKLLTEEEARKLRRR